MQRIATRAPGRKRWATVFRRVRLHYCRLFGGPGFFGSLSPKVDQQVGGIVMKFIQEFIFASMLAYVFYHWYKKENGQEDTDVSASPSALAEEV
ncbi:cytochrome c oxidase assembly protein [Paenibacillus rhizoplanae]